MMQETLESLSCFCSINKICLILNFLCSLVLHQQQLVFYFTDNKSPFVLETDLKGSCVMIYTVMGENKLRKNICYFCSCCKEKELNNTGRNPAKSEKD